MKWIKPSTIEGKLTSPPSKSLTLRATAAALLGQGMSRIGEPSCSDDAAAGFRIARALGAQMRKENGVVTVEGRGPMSGSILDCRESGLCLRMFAPIAALSREKMVLAGSGSLVRRPMGMVEAPLRRLGVRCTTRDGFQPVEVTGPLKSGRVTIDGSTSSQFLTGLLFALPLCSGDSEIQAVNLKSKAYAAMTVDLISRFAVRIETSRDLRRFFIPGSQKFVPASYTVEGDWSGGAFLLVAGAVAGKVIVGNLQPGSLQPDKKILEVLDLAGARVDVAGGSVAVEKGILKPFVFDATESPDLFPPLAVLACACPGKTVIHGAERLIHKESNRALALASGLSGIGAGIRLDGNRMEIEGGRLRGGIIDSRGDHRIAMAGAVAGLISEKGVLVSDWKCVSKSYPGFFDDLESVREDQP